MYRLNIINPKARNQIVASFRFNSLKEVRSDYAVLRKIDTLKRAKQEVYIQIVRQDDLSNDDLEIISTIKV